jgi:hypothetical protein
MHIYDETMINNVYTAMPDSLLRQPPDPFSNCSSKSPKLPTRAENGGKRQKTAERQSNAKRQKTAENGRKRQSNAKRLKTAENGKATQNG